VQGQGDGRINDVQGQGDGRINDVLKAISDVSTSISPACRREQPELFFVSRSSKYSGVVACINDQGFKMEDSLLERACRVIQSAWLCRYHRHRVLAAAPVANLRILSAGDCHN
jgi:hypothetical protein